MGIEAMSIGGAAMARVLDQAGAASATEIEVAGATITKILTVASTTARIKAGAASVGEVEVGVPLAQAVVQVGADVPTEHCEWVIALSRLTGFIFW